MKLTCALRHVCGAPEDLTGGQPNARPAATTYVFAARASAMSPRAVALRGDLTQAELKTARNAGLNDAARRHRGSIEIQGETKDDP